MIRPRRTLPFLAAIGAALLLVSCGVDPGDAMGGSGTTQPSESTATTVDRDLTPEQQQMADTMASAYKDLGFTDEEATCLSEGIAGSLDPSGTPDMTAMMDVINQCDIPMDRLMEIQGGMGDGTTEGALKESLEAGMKANGMSDEDASCVSDAFVEKYGVDVEAMLDPDKMGPIAEDCGVDPSKIPSGN